MVIGLFNWFSLCYLAKSWDIKSPNVWIICSIPDWNTVNLYKLMYSIVRYILNYLILVLANIAFTRDKIHFQIRNILIKIFMTPLVCYNVAGTQFDLKKSTIGFLEMKNLNIAIEQDLILITQGFFLL